MKCKTCGHDVSDITCCEVCYPPDTSVYVVESAMKNTISMPKEDYIKLVEKAELYKKYAYDAISILWRMEIHINMSMNQLPELHRELGNIDPVLTGHPFNVLKEHTQMLKTISESKLARELLKLR